MLEKKIGVIGAGNMGSALIRGILASELASPCDIYVSDTNLDKLNALKEKDRISITTSNTGLVHSSDIIILAVKPQIMGDVLEEIAVNAKGKLFVSIAAGITIEFMQSKLGTGRIVRVMPNTPCMVGETAATFALGKDVTTQDVFIVNKILNSVGKAFMVKEEMLDAVTALSGSGPAFFAYFADEMAKAAMEEGLPEDIAYDLVCQTMVGTGKLLQETGMTPYELIKMVSSPGGTTVAGLGVLDVSNAKGMLKRMVRAAAERSRELGK